MTIQELCVKYGTDKTPELGHPYAPIYDKLFKNLKVERILEIGIGFRETMERHIKDYKPGASLRVWRDFFPEAQIYGIDIGPEAMITDEPRITTLIGDSTDYDWMVSQNLPTFDIIIDDGSHEHHDQLKTANNWLPKATQFYFIEDVAWPNFQLRNLAQWNPQLLIEEKGNRLIMIKK